MFKKKKFLIFLIALVMLFNTSAFSLASVENVTNGTVEVEELRGSNYETYLLPDGSYQCVVFSEDKYYMDSNGEYTEIDNTLKLVQQGRSRSTEYQYTNTANLYDIRFTDGVTPSVSMSTYGEGFQFSPLNSNLVLAEIGEVENCATLSNLTETGENTISYEDIYTDTDFVYVVSSGVVKEYIVLNSVQAPIQFDFSFVLNGLTMENNNGQISFLDEDNVVVFTLGNLYAVDANGEYTDALEYAVTLDEEGNTTVSVAIDEDYVYSDSRMFPIVIDPSIMVSSVQTADACVTSLYPTQNYYTSNWLRTGRDEDFLIRRSYIRFDLPFEIDGDNVTSAYLRIRKYSGAAPSIKAYRVTGNWVSSEITWNTKPTYTSTNSSPVAVLDSNDWYKANVTGIVQDWLNGTNINYGFLLKDQTETGTNQWTTFYSSDAASPNKPELIINYTAKRPRITLDLRLYYNSDMTVPYTTLSGYADIASETFISLFNVDFNRLWTASSSSINQKNGCERNQLLVCNSSCGALENCEDTHHRSAQHFLYVNTSGTDVKVLRYVDYVMCYYKTSEARHMRVNGLSSGDDDDAIVTLRSDNIQRTTCHELAHCIGAADDVCTEGQYCVMTSGSPVDNVWCDRCSRDIVEYLEDNYS